MLDNSVDRFHNVFFYGLYMDPEILSARGVVARDPRQAVVSDYILRIGNKATLLREPGQQAHGMVYSLTHEEIDKLYWGAGLDEYVAEALLADIDGEGKTAVLCCNLLQPPAPEESSQEYSDKLKQVMNKLGLPATFV